MSIIIALDASEWQGELSKQHMQYAYDMGVRLYIAQLWGSGPTGRGSNDYADEQLGFAKEVGMALAGYIWVPPDDTLETAELVKVSLEAAGQYVNELVFVAPDLEGSRLHPTNPVGRLMNVIEHLTLANKNVVIYCRKNNWPIVMGTGVTEFSRYPLWEARYYLSSGFKPDVPPDIDWKWSKFGGWQERAILQYAGTAPVNGWSADWNIVDTDRLGFDLSSDTTPPPIEEEDILMSSQEYDELAARFGALDSRLASIDARVKTLSDKTNSVDTQLKNHARQYHPSSPQPTPSPTRKDRTYVVVAGDSLSLIAKRLSNNAGRFTELVALNQDKYPSLRTDPNYIREGWVLRIPADW